MIARGLYKDIPESWDVVITKDSETPEDIGVPAVVVGKLKGVICGYHLAIIRPDQEKIDSVYLANSLKTLRVRKQFYKYANGATRFGLSTGDIGKIEILAPKISEQKKIANVLSGIDEEILTLKQKLALITRQKKGLMQKLLTGKIRVKV
ncbi:MAG: restriction endonuclease subunit S [Candidatus Omnitrophica bacterium]|nr:restriction endonuclease subunit S [Candidatus Omnitrophota bacterium]